MKVLIYIALWKRESINNLFCLKLQEFIDYAWMEHNISVTPFFIYSRDVDRKNVQPFFSKSKFVYSENKPLGRKLNSGLLEAFFLDWDYFMGFGCDDIIHRDYWDVVAPLMKQKKDIIGMRRLVSYDLATGRMKLTGPTPMVYGAGRCIRRDLVERAATRYTVMCKHSNTDGDRRGQVKSVPIWKYKPAMYTKVDKVVEFWPPEKNNAMDAGSMARIFESNPSSLISQTAIDDRKLFCVDIKTEDNINAFDKLPGYMIEGRERNDLLNRFGIIERVKDEN